MLVVASVVEADGIDIAGDIEPMSALTLAEMGRRQEVSQSGARTHRDCCRPENASSSSGVGGSCDQIETVAPHERASSASGENPRPFSSQLAEQKRIDRCGDQRADWTPGIAGRASGRNDQVTGRSASRTSRRGRGESYRMFGSALARSTRTTATSFR